jgi:hypothetical protein
VDCYLIIWEGGREYVLRKGNCRELEALAKKLRAARLFRYVRVDTRVPPETPLRPPHQRGGQPSGGKDPGGAPPEAGA